MAILDDVGYILVGDQDHILTVRASEVWVHGVWKPMLTPSFFDTSISDRIDIGRVRQDTGFNATHDRRKVWKDLIGLNNTISRMERHDVFSWSATLAVSGLHAILAADVTWGAGVGDHPAWLDTRSGGDIRHPPVKVYNGMRARRPSATKRRRTVIIAVVLADSGTYTIGIASRRSDVTGARIKIRLVFEKLVELGLNALDFTGEVPLSRTWSSLGRCN